MGNKYTKRYCKCKEWEESLETRYDADKLSELLSHYPDTCPYCHSKLETRPRKIFVCISFEPELYDRHEAQEQWISLDIVKQMLKEI